METLADRPIRTLLKEYDDYLKKDFLPFMERHVVDAAYGGFMCHTDPTGKNITQHKRTWYDGRGIWVYSFLYNHIENDPRYLQIATKTVEFVLQVKKYDALHWPWSYDREGKDLKEHPPDLYGNLFIAEGFAEYSSAAGDPSYWEQSKEILVQCMATYDQKGYGYRLEYSPIATFTIAERVLGHWMIMLRLSTNLLRIKEDQDVKEINNRCIDALVNKHFNPKFGLMNEVLKHDFSQESEAIEQFVYCGHAIESLWMLMDEALRRGDQVLFDLAAARFKVHVELAWDDEYGGVLHCLNHVDDQDWLFDKVLWAQEEVLVGLMLLIEHREDPWAVHWFDKVYSYVVSTFPMHQQGFPLWKIAGNRKMEVQGIGDRVENFHHPRHLMLNQLSIRRIMKKQSASVQDGVVSKKHNLK